MAYNLKYQNLRQGKGQHILIPQKQLKNSGTIKHYSKPFNPEFR